VRLLKWQVSGLGGIAHSLESACVGVWVVYVVVEKFNSIGYAFEDLCMFEFNV
jgi:hypothetical protein